MLRLIVLLAVLAGLAFGTSGASAQVTCFGSGSVLTCMNPSGGPAYQANCFGKRDYLTCQSQQGSFAGSANTASRNTLITPSGPQSGLDGLAPPQAQLVPPCLVPLTCLSGSASSADAMSQTPLRSVPSAGNQPRPVAP